MGAIIADVGKERGKFNGSQRAKFYPALLNEMGNKIGNVGACCARPKSGAFLQSFWACAARPYNETFGILSVFRYNRAHF